MDSIQDKLIEQFQNMDNAYEAYAKSKGLTYLSLMVLDEIYALGDGCTQKQISEDTHYPKQSINLVVKAFLEDGIVELRELPENRKNKGITLTEKVGGSVMMLSSPYCVRRKQLCMRWAKKKALSFSVWLSSTETPTAGLSKKYCKPHQI